MTLFTILLATALLILLIARFNWHPLLAILLVAMGLGFAFGMPGGDVIKTISSGFGSILSGIGLVVILGSIIGIALERSGAALVVAESVLDLFGPKRPALAVSIIGALVSIPVFCDSGFILLNGLNKSLARRSGANFGVLSLAMAAGLYTTHTLVPPTPGPIAAAGQLGADGYLGTIMLLGGLVTIPVLLVSVYASKRLGRNIKFEINDLDYRSSKAETTPADSAPMAPTKIWSFLPLLLPILLIAAGTMVQFSGWRGPVAEVFTFIGQPLPALLLGLLPAYQLSRGAKASWSEWITEAIKLSGPILIITGAGGAFGAILKSSDLATEISQYLGNEAIGLTAIILLAFGIAAVLKTAQGSSTNALVITAGMIAPLAIAANLDGAYAYALVVLAIGGGAMTVSHANDSYFWVVTRFSGIPTATAYRTYTLLTAIMGLTVLVMVLLLSFFA